MANKPELKVSVRTLIEFFYRQGDLDLETYISSRRMQQGIRAHQKLQKQRPAGYEKEVSLKYSFEAEDFIMVIRGRIDGIYKSETETVLEEIKSITKDPEAIIGHSYLLWWGQAKIYGAIYCQQQDLEGLDIQLVLYHLERHEEIDKKQYFSSEELQKFLETVIARYYNWAAKLSARQQARDKSLERLVFPYHSYRKGQREMAVEVYHMIRDSGHLLVQAPTGIGKTLAAIFPALKALGNDLADRIFYLTARTTGKMIAAQTAAILAENDLDCRFIVLTSKERICPNPGSACHPDECEYARGFYDRLEAAIYDIFAEKIYDRDIIESYSMKHRICPFEFSLDIALWCDCIICDYNYAFDPRVYLRRFFEASSERYAFLIDEAHNLVDRAREMFSCDLTKSETLSIRRKLKGQLLEIYKLLTKINNIFLQYKKEMEKDQVHSAEIPGEIDAPARKFIQATDKWLSLNYKTGFRKDLLEYYFKVNAFLWGCENFSESYRTLFHREEQELTIKLFCLDPAQRLAECLQRCQSAAFFSATLTPFDYYRELFGCSDDAQFLSLPTPFPPENLLITRKKIQTRYRRREETIGQLCEAIIYFLRQQNGNVLVFFPSYRYLKMGLEIIEQADLKHQILVQKTGMSEAEREEYLLEFHKTGELKAGFAVMGGVFGEGIDLVGDTLTAAVIVGVGLPGIDQERELIRNYYEDREKGYNYAYTYPGFTRVLQAAGRVIRTETDLGSILLIDDRFFTMKYHQLFPNWWRT